jgi:hypothetical protein
VGRRWRSGEPLPRSAAGATKLKVLSKLSAQEGQAVLERFVSGNVRFFGGNLRATHDLAPNVAKAIEQSTSPLDRVLRSSWHGRTLQFPTLGAEVEFFIRMRAQLNSRVIDPNRSLLHV